MRLASGSFTLPDNIPVRVGRSEQRGNGWLCSFDEIAACTGGAGACPVTCTAMCVDAGAS